MAQYHGPAPVMGDLLKINQHLWITCGMPTCAREERWPAAKAVERFGFNCTILEARRRAVCARCGASGRGNRIDLRPCTLDGSAWAARQKHASDPVGYPAERLADTLFTLTKLLGGRGELGGDGRGWAGARIVRQ